MKIFRLIVISVVISISSLFFFDVNICYCETWEGKLLEHHWKFSKPKFDGRGQKVVKCSFRMIVRTNENLPLLSSQPISTIIFGSLPDEIIKSVALDSFKRGFFFPEHTLEWDPNDRRFNKYNLTLLKYDKILGDYYNEIKSLDEFEMADVKEEIIPKLMEYARECRREIEIYKDTILRIKSKSEGKLSVKNYDIEKSVLKIPVLNTYGDFGVDYLAYPLSGRNASKLLKTGNVTYHIVCFIKPRQSYCIVNYDLISMKVVIKKNGKIVTALNYNGFKCIHSIRKRRIGTRYAVIKSMIRESEAGWQDKYNRKKIENLIGMKFVRIPAGDFLMGCKGHDTKPHKVTLDAFYIQTTEVTMGQWRLIMGDIRPDDSSRTSSSGKADKEYRLMAGKDDNMPVTNTWWRNAVEFVRRLNKKERIERYRLPSEAEWEYACRAGNTGRFCFGNDSKKLGNYAWYGKNSRGSVHPVGQKKANVWGLFDMHGNAWEWCWDFYNHNYYSSSPLENPQGPSEGSTYVKRGGNFYSVYYRSYGGDLTCGIRNDSQSPNAGFRVVLDISDINYLTQTSK